MSSVNWEHEFFEVMQSEHQQLTDLLKEVRAALTADDRDKNHVADVITRLCELVESHFSHEERGGYMKEAMERAPRMSSQAEVLLDQHEPLLEEVEKLRLLINSGVESDAWWTRIESDFHKFASRLINHEHAENKLVQEAYTQDIGTGD